MTFAQRLSAKKAATVTANHDREQLRAVGTVSHRGRRGELREFA